MWSCVVCQYQQQTFPSPSNYQTQQQHNQPISRPHEHHEHHEHRDYHKQIQQLNYQQPESPQTFDFDKFNQQAKQLQDSLHYFNQQQQNHVQQQINSVHQDGNEPHFDFEVNGNYTDLENASEQFVNLGRLVGKQNIGPKVIKITKTMAIKQPVPVPYPVPVVKVVKEHSPFQFSNHGQHGHHHVPMPTERPSSDFKHSSFYNNYPTQAPASSETYRHHQSAPTEFDTAPFYVTTPQKETIKIVPVPYYVDEHGNRHEISPSTSHASPSHDADSEAFYPSRQAPSSSDDNGKFQTFTFSYHPPTPHSHPQHHQQQVHSSPDTKYYYTHDSDSSASSDATAHYAAEQERVHEQVEHEQGEPEQHYQYKYVTYE